MIENQTFAEWSESVHHKADQIKRIEAARKPALTPVSIDKDLSSAVFSGRHGIYHTSLSTCECHDYKVRKLPCKHIYRLAYELELYDLAGKVEKSSDSIIVPEDIIIENNQIAIASVVDTISCEHYDSILAVLHAIQETERPSSLGLAIDYISSKLKESASTSFPEGTTIAITGTLSIHDRSETLSLVEQHGIRCSGSISRKTNFLIIGKDPLPDKVNKASDLGIPILTEEAFWQIFEREQ